MFCNSEQLVITYHVSNLISDKLIRVHNKFIHCRGLYLVNFTLVYSLLRFAPSLLIPEVWTFIISTEKNWNWKKMGFAGKVVLITGASSGIGAATALHLARLGAKLALTGRNQDQLTQVSKSCLSVSPNQPLLINVDLTVEKDTEAMVDKIINHYQKLDVLVNNAGKILFLNCWPPSSF